MNITLKDPKPATSTTGLPHVRHLPRLKFGGGRYLANEMLDALDSTTCLAGTMTTSEKGLPVKP